MTTEEEITYIKEALESADPYIIQQIYEFLVENEVE